MNALPKGEMNVAQETREPKVAMNGNQNGIMNGGHEGGFRIDDNVLYKDINVSRPTKDYILTDETLNDAEIKADGAEQCPPPIAIVGMGMRLPGGVRSAESFWNLLINREDGRGIVPGDRFNVEGFRSSSGRHGTIKSPYGYFIQEANLQHFDASFFSMNKTEVERLDPQQRMLLEVVWECMENGGQVGWRGKDIGCYVGVFGEDWLDLSSKDTQNLGMYRITGSGDFALANRVSYEYDLGGPSMTIRTGCSSSLIGLHEACQAIAHGDCESAIVAGTNLIITPTMTIAMTEQGVLSPTGSCKSFDAKADGYARGEAINAVFIKELSKALSDGDPIRAVIQSTATNCDGRTAGMALPSSESHESMIRRAYQVAQLPKISQTAFVECHGTGTAIGDPLEVTAVANVFGGEGVFIGSVKPNIGHSEGASGITSLIKAVLALERRIIPPNINFSEPNPKIPFEKAKLCVPLEPTPWPRHRAERVSVNSFGIGGANAHVIVDSAASFVPKRSPPQYKDPAVPLHHLLVFSANCADSLKKGVQGHQRYASAHPDALADMAYTLGARREHLTHRAFCVTDGTKPLAVSPFSRAKSAPRITFVFTGQGAQWAGMGVELLKDSAEFLAEIRRLDYYLTQLPNPSSWTIENELLKPEERTRIHEAEFSQPLCTAIQIGIVTVLRSIGVAPAAVVGHSSGEIAAAYASNAITAEAAITIAYYRGNALKKQNRAGGMTAVAMSKEAVSSFLIHGVVVACENSPSSVTLSGDKEKLDAVANAIKAVHPGVLIRALKVEMAYYSSHMEKIGKTYEELLRGRVPSIEPSIPFYSSVTGERLPESMALSESYWRRNLESPVLFHSAVRNALSENLHDNLYLEIGPHSALSGPLRQIFQSFEGKANSTYVSTLARGKNCVQAMLETLGNLFLQAVPFDFETVAKGHTVLTDLDTYSWLHDKQYWQETRVTREWRFRKFAPHELLGSRTLEGNDLEPVWRNVLSPEAVPWIEDHKIANDTVFPAAGYIAMAGEAIRQVRNKADFALRKLVIKSALILQESKSVEMMTSLRPVRLTTVLDASWYEFSISSYNASASLVDRERDVENVYQIHPTTIDQCLQLFTVAMSKGVSRHMSKLCVPTSIEELYIKQGTRDMQIEVDAQATKNGSISGDAFAVAGGDCVLRLRGAKFSPLDDGDSSEEVDTIAGAFLHWKPDIDFAPLDQLIRVRASLKESKVRLEELTLLCILESSHRITSIDTKSDHLVKFRSWLGMQGDRAKRGEYKSVEDAQQLPQLDRAERLRRIQQLDDDIQTTAVANVSAVIIRLLSHCEDIFNEKTEAIDVLLQDGGLWNIYNFHQDVWDCRKYFEQLGHSIPTLKILEIGAGTGGTTAGLLKELVAPSGENLYSRYCFTDISAGFLVSAKERFKEYQNIDYAVLDISQDPSNQGFELGSYDLIVASNVLHATPNLESTLCHVRKLLRPTGRLFLQELTPELRMINFIMGFLPGWWLGDEDGRSDEPFVSVERWDRELRLAGFSGVDVAVYDDDQPWQINVSIVSRAIEDKPLKRITREDVVTLLCEDEMNHTTQEVKTTLEKNGIHVRVSTLDCDPPATGDIISILDWTSPFFDNVTNTNLASFQRYVGNLGNSGVLWLTGSVQMGCQDPRYAQAIGVARTVRSELLNDFATVELDVVDSDSIDTVSKIFRKFQARGKASDVDCDFEYAVTEGVVQIPRYYWTSVRQKLRTVTSKEIPLKLEIAKFGLLQSLQWVQQKPNTLVGDQVEVELRAVGLNFKDVLVCMGVVEGTKEGLGLEGSGIIRNVGPDVQDLRIGDRVCMFEHGCFSTRMITSSQAVAKIPDDLSFEEAATMPCVYVTVIHSLITVGQLKKDQTILIQSACGGVGLAAIQIAKMIGAQIFATVGSEEKVRYLVDSQSIRRDRIFSSRNTSFYQDIMRETHGKGVDVVLNSLSGELLHTSWQCVAAFGQMLEIGKRDFIGSGKLDMDIFENNRAFFGIDLAQLCVSRPEVCQRLLRECVKLYHQGSIRPIKPTEIFEAKNVADAFRYMQKGQHIGKIVVTMPDNPRDLEVTPIHQEPQLRPNKSYLLVGGLGGLGRAISTWLVERGARNLIYLSRSAGNSEDDRLFIRELAAQGCSVQTFAKSVTSLHDVEYVVKSAAAPIAGVMHMSMVLKDRPLSQFSHEEWQAAIMPKVTGSWNLHEALAQVELDFFILFSSISGIVGQWGQCNYAAANTFMDSFVQYRHRLGLPASVLDIGVMEDVGYVSENTAVLEQFKATSLYTLRERDLLDALQLMMANNSGPMADAAGYMNPAQLVIGLKSTKSLSDPSNRAIWKKDVRMSMYRNLETSIETTSSIDSAGLKQFLANVASDPSCLKVQSNLAFLTQKAGCKLYEFMLQPEEEVDVKVALSALGVDSLLAIEIRNWCRQSFGIELSVLEIMNSGTIEGFGKTIADHLYKKYEAPDIREGDDTYLLMKAP
ncbi:MAG: Type I Iterative PKS [Bathelium mastoideum]|nr:MAG: Type I Iterative PKS [Bathelium mastoideum]